MTGKKNEIQPNPTALGDPVSLKAETGTSPTRPDHPERAGSGDSSTKGRESLREVARRDLDEAKKGNRSMLGDPVSLKAETSERDPVGKEKDGMGSVTGNKERDSKM